MHEPLQSDVQTLADLPAGSCLLKKYEELHLFAVFQDFLFCFYINRDDSHQGFGLFEDFDLVEFNVPNKKNII